MEGSGNNISASSGSQPWTEILRGAEPDLAGAPSSIGQEVTPPESGDNGNAGGNKKPAWNKRPSNCSVVDSGGGGAVVMGAASWPALSESTTKGSMKVSDSGSASSQTTVLSPFLEVRSVSQNPTTTSAHGGGGGGGRPGRQKSMKRDGGGGSGNVQANGGFSYSHSPREGVQNHNSSIKPSSGAGAGAGAAGSGSGGGGGGDHNHHHQQHQNHNHNHSQQRNSFRRGNSFPRRGDQERGNHDWNNNHNNRSFNGRDGSMHQHRGSSPRGFVRPPPVSSPFLHSVGHPPPMRPFMNPMGIDMPMVLLPPGFPYVGPLPPPIYFPAPDPELKARIAKQIGYYFSNENLVRDTYLRRNMDEYGWVPVVLIAGFKKVKELTVNIPLILEAVESSSIVEAQGDKIRKRGDWKRWIMPPSVNFTNVAVLQSPSSPNVSTLSAHMLSVTLDEKTADIDDEALLKSSGDSSSPHTTTDGASSSGC